MSFPWTNFITAASTLAAALGVTALNARTGSLQRRHERRSRRTEIRVEAYAEFLRSARANARLLGQSMLYFAHGAPGDPKAEEIIEKTDDTVDAFNTACGRVEIIGTAQAAQAAAAVADAARRLGRRCSTFYLPGGPFDMGAAEAELNALRRVTDHFAASCQDELTEHN